MDGARVTWRFEGTWTGEAATFKNGGDVFKSGSPEQPRLQFYGTFTVNMSGAKRRFPAIVTADVALGPVQDCA